MSRERDGKPSHGLVPIEEDERLCRGAEDLADPTMHDTVTDRQTVPAEIVPAEIVHRIMAGENRVPVWREHRGLSPDRLARRGGVSQASLSSIETGKRWLRAGAGGHRPRPRGRARRSGGARGVSRRPSRRTPARARLHHRPDRLG